MPGFISNLFHPPFPPSKSDTSPTTFSLLSRFKSDQGLPTTARGGVAIADMGDGSDYPSPRSEGPGGPTSILVTAQQSLSPTSKMNEQLSPGFVESARPRLSVRRARDPPKNPAGHIYCDHPDCQTAPPTFRRPCEWK